MYLIGLNEGYLQVDGVETENDCGSIIGFYEIIEFPGGVDCEISLNGKKQTVKIIPYGQIFLNYWNENKHNNLFVKSVFPNGQLFNTVSDYVFDLINSGDFDLPYLNVSYVPNGGEIIPVFKVDDINQLWTYDNLQIKIRGINIKRCPDCGKAFIAAKRALRCPECREIGIKNQRKKNLIDNPGRRKLYGIADIATKRENRKLFSQNNESQLYHKEYITPMRNICKEKIKTLSKEDLISYAEWLQNIDKQFYQLFVRIEKSGNEELIENWHNDRYNIWKQKNPAEWLNEWIEKVNIVDVCHVES